MNENLPTRLCDLGKIEIPIIAEWPNCQDMRIDRWVLNNSEQFFKFIARIEHERLLEKIFHEVTISNNGRHNTNIVVKPVTCDATELAAFNHVISIILADKLMVDGYHYPPIDTYFDERNRSILDCKIKIKPCVREILNDVCQLQNTNFDETLSHMDLVSTYINTYQSPDSLYFPKENNYWMFKLEISIFLSNRCLTTWYPNEGVFHRSNRTGSCITHRIPFLTLLHHLKKLTSRNADDAPSSIFSTVNLQNLISECDDIRCKTSNYNRRTCENAMSWIQESHNSNTHNSLNFNNSAVIDILPYPPNFDNNLHGLFNNFPVELKIHQKNAISRMLAQEQVDLEEKFYININENYKFCPITNSFKENGENQTSQRNCRGGFFCDDTGLGKTMSILSLCACTSKKGPSLIVVPVSVLHHWKRELTKLHNMNLDSFNYYDQVDDLSQRNLDVPNLLHFYVYYGQSRIRNSCRLSQENSVIITTYATLMRDFSKLCNMFSADNVDGNLERASPLHFINFQRLVLDESHKIPTSSKMSLLQIKTKITWCISATPLGSNRLSPNLHAQLDIILNQTPAVAWTFPNLDRRLDQPNIWNQPRNTLVDINPKAWRTHIMAIDHEMHPLMNNPMLVDRLDIIFGPCILVHLLSKLVVRNTTEHANSLQRQVLIPSLNYVNITTTLSNEQNAEYANILTFIKNMIHRYQRNGATCLRRFNSLRQWLSLSGCNISEETSQSMTQRPPVLSHEAREALGITPDETCSVCLETFTQPCLLPCNHFLCYSCVLSIHNHARGRNSRCPLCRNNYVEQELRLYEELPARINTESVEDEMPQKIQKLIEYLTLNNLQKCVIFSEFKATHEVLKKWFNQSPDQNIRNISVMILNGTLTAAARNKIILKFESEPNCILILSVRACVAGINLQSANTVVFMEPMISKSDEHQAIGRVRRIGQQSPTVNVVKIVYENTIEEKISQVGEGWRPNVHNMLAMLN